MATIDALTIGPDSEVTMHFTLSLNNGTIIETTRGHDPVCFSMGDGSVIEGLEQAMYGLKSGEQQCLSLEPRDAFGFPEQENIHEMPRSEFSDDIDLQVDNIVNFSIPSGEEIPGRIQEVLDDKVIVDFNHPLAGHNVIFEVEILEINPNKI
ncbi:MAG: FKBP-type peptidyl-prolyl cis-trans isomerase [Gammaproteobacteria bacterium]|nr:FKBP-type peptidyl-prolyl cis-trans isomerase [Gammaproteobacteria bacterium]